MLRADPAAQGGQATVVAGVHFVLDVAAGRC
jgi:membrane-associated phospholipid phosphatase